MMRQFWNSIDCNIMHTGVTQSGLFKQIWVQPTLRGGWLKLLQQALRVRPDGVGAFGIPCGSYIFLNSPTHKRDASNPFGDESFAYIRTANEFLDRWYHLWWNVFLGAGLCGALFSLLVVDGD